MQANLAFNPSSGDLECLTLQPSLAERWASKHVLLCSVYVVEEVELGPGACWVRTNGTGISTGHANVTRILIC